MRAPFVATSLLLAAGCSVSESKELAPRPELLAPAVDSFDLGVEYTFTLVGYESDLGGEFFVAEPDGTLFIDEIDGPISEYSFTPDEIGTWALHFDPAEPGAFGTAWLQFEVSLVPQLTLASAFPLSAGDDLLLPPFATLCAEVAGADGLETEVTFTDTAGALDPLVFPLPADDPKLLLPAGLPPAESGSTRWEVTAAVAGSTESSTPQFVVQEPLTLRVGFLNDQRFVPSGGSITFGPLLDGQPVPDAEVILFDESGNPVLPPTAVTGVAYTFDPPVTDAITLYRVAFRSGTLLSPYEEFSVAGSLADGAGFNFGSGPFTVDEDFEVSFDSEAAPPATLLLFFVNLNTDAQVPVFGADPAGFLQSLPSAGRWTISSVIPGLELATLSLVVQEP